MTQKNGTSIYRKITWATGSILGIAAVITLIITSFGGQVFATKMELKGYVTKEVHTLTLKQYELEFLALKTSIAENNKLVRQLIAKL